MIGKRSLTFNKHVVGCLMLFALGILLILLPTSVEAFDFNWRNPSGDKSLYYLSMIFGNVGSALPDAAGNPIVGNLFSIFNIAVLTLGSLVVSYTIVLSAINTAQEGELMGKKWSSMWIPFRSAVGVAFLLPTGSGYSLLQILMMNIIVLGIAGANQLWQQVVNAALSKTGMGLFGQVELNGNAFNTTSKNLLRSMVCAQVYNYNPVCSASIGGQFVGAYVQGNSLMIGVENSPTLSELCGSVEPGKKPANAYDRQSWNMTNISAFAAAAAYLADPAREIVQGSVFPSYSDIIPTASNMMQGTIAAAPQIMKPSNDSAAKQAISNGWIFAGSYYFMLSSHNKSPNWRNNSPSSTFSDPETSTECKAELNKALRASINYTRATQVKMSSSSDDENEDDDNDLPSGGGKKGGKFKNAIMKPLKDGINKIMDLAMKGIKQAQNLNQAAGQKTQSFGMQALTGRTVDPIVSLQRTGSDILEASEALWLGLTVGAFVLLLAGCAFAMFNPFCPAITAALSLLTPLFTVLIALMWAAGVALGIYLPLIPYLVFTFTAIGWLILVIEAIAAAPIVALGLVSPAQEAMGKASASVMILTNVFLRPSLMVIGFIIAAKLVRAGVVMINYGFLTTVEASIGNLGILGSIALIMLYAGIIMSLVSESFSLIHILPDKIMRWIGGTQESSGVKEKLGEAKQATQKGGEATVGVMKGSLGYAQEQIGEKAKQSPGTMGAIKNILGKGGGGKPPEDIP